MNDPDTFFGYPYPNVHTPVTVEPDVQAEVVAQLDRLVTATCRRADAFEMQLFLRAEAVHAAWFAKDGLGCRAWRDYMLERSRLATRLADDIDGWLG